MTREEAKKNLEELYMHLQTSPAISARDYRTAVKLAIEALQERPKGRWKQFQDFKHLKECSECGYVTDFTYKFCNECGADMRELPGE